MLVVVYASLVKLLKKGRRTAKHSNVLCIFNKREMLFYEEIALNLLQRLDLSRLSLSLPLIIVPCTYFPIHL